MRGVLEPSLVVRTGADSSQLLFVSRVSVPDIPVSFDLPGGSEPYADCGTIGFKGHLSDGLVHFKAFPHSCNRFSCSVCWVNWKHRQALSVSDRLSEYVKLGGEIIHYTVSPEPRKVETLADYMALRSEMYRVAKRVGILGGVAIFHYFRHPSTKNDRTDICPDNPHWHILGDSYFFDGFRRQHLNIDQVKRLSGSGWIVKYIGKRASYAQMFKSIDYCLRWSSRVSCPYADLPNFTMPKVEVITWFGILGYNCFSSVKYHSEGVKCPVCEQIIAVRDWHWITFKEKPPPDHHGVLSCDPSEKYSFSMCLTWNVADEVLGGSF